MTSLPLRVAPAKKAGPLKGFEALKFMGTHCLGPVSSAIDTDAKSSIRAVSGEHITVGTKLRSIDGSKLGSVIGRALNSELGSVLGSIDGSKLGSILDAHLGPGIRQL